MMPSKSIATRVDCLVMGEPGTGKSVVKRHDESRQRVVVVSVSRTMHTYSIHKILCSAFSIGEEGLRDL